MKKIIDLHVKQFNDPTTGKRFSLAFLRAMCASRFWSLEELFELTQRPSTLTHTLLLELQRNKDTVFCAVPGAEVPGHCQEQLMQILVLCLLKSFLFLLFQRLVGPGLPLAPSFRLPWKDWRRVSERAKLDQVG